MGTVPTVDTTAYERGKPKVRSVVSIPSPSRASVHNRGHHAVLIVVAFSYNIFFSTAASPIAWRNTAIQGQRESHASWPKVLIIRNRVHHRLCKRQRRALSPCGVSSTRQPPLNAGPIVETTTALCYTPCTVLTMGH